MMPYAIMQQTLPVRAAEHGQPSEADTVFSLEPFSESVLSHLKSAHRGTSTQDGKKFSDEESFLSYMASDKSNAMSSPASNDLKYPLSSYYISSSHNTYLSGHQLYGDASVDAYKNVLKRGCRCLEIDVWDGDSDSDTSSSDEEEERSKPKPSKWNRVKARAARMRSRSRSGSLTTSFPPPVAGAAQFQLENAASQRHAEASSLDPNYLSPQPSPSFPKQNEPRVFHGFTLTQPITFRSVCYTIKESAFVSTDLPLIVSLEVHASLSQQELMVEIMRDTWSGFLVDISNQTEISALPSPESLRRKILIKVKWTPNTETGESNNPIDHVTANSTDDGPEDATPTSPDKKRKASKVLAALSELGVYTRAYTFRHFGQPEASIPTHVFSLSENKVHTIHTDPVHGPALFDHNKHYLMRVFPKGTRINSSNVDPTFHWRQGAQMVALNWQKIDKGMMLNEGMFAGMHGWVLKPEGYRCSKTKTSVDASILPKTQHLNLEIRLLAAQRLPLPADKEGLQAVKMKPYVKVQLHVDTHLPLGHGKRSNGSDNAKDEAETYNGEDVDVSIYKRRSVTCRTDCPDFGGETMSWPNVPDVVDELSFLRYVCLFADHDEGMPVRLEIFQLRLHREEFCLVIPRTNSPILMVPLSS